MSSAPQKVNTTNNTKSYTNTQLLYKLYKLTSPYKWLFWAAVLVTLITAPVSVLRPSLIQYTVDTYILALDINGLMTMVGLLVVVLMMESILLYFFTYLTDLLGQTIISDLRVALFRHINYQKLSKFDKTPIGVNLTRTINDMESINSVFSDGVIVIVADIFSIVVVLAMMLYSSWQLTLWCLITLPLLLIATNWFKKAIKNSYEEVRNQVGKLNSFLQERISGMRIVQIFNVQDKQSAKFDVINEAYTKANLDSIFAYALFFPIVEILSAATLGIVVWYGSGQILEETASIGILVVFPLYLGKLFGPIRMLADKFNSLQNGLIAANRVFTLLDSKDSEINEGKVVPSSIKGDIVFDNVFFSYNSEAALEGKQAWTLNGVSFHLPAGQTLAIVGSTGAGKSTIISILNRFYDIQKGNISIDGIDLYEYELGALRKRIAIVLQDVFLFSDSVFENIRLRDKNISLETVQAAAKLIGADEFIQRLPGAYDYQVSERGATLSMGQRQLISFVRALVFNPDILILDEATSGIDPETENVIQNAIKTLTVKRTSIVIAHRLVTIQHADQIMVMEKGNIMEMGNHNTLMQNPDSHYRKLVEASLLPES